MVIQRIQSVYLLLAAVIMVLVNFIVPAAQVSGGDATLDIYLSSITPLMVLNLITASIMAINIFMYKNLRMQIKVTRICIVLVIASALIEAWVLLTLQDGLEAKWTGSAIMLACALILTIAAYKGMKKDHKLLTSYDRLR